MIKWLFVSLVAVVSVAVAFFSGVLMERNRSMREDHLVHAGLIVNLAKVVEAGDQTKTKRMTELQMLAALRCTVNYSEVPWWESLKVLPVESGIRRIWMPRIADYVSKHPEIKLTDGERSLILIYLGKGNEIEEKKTGQQDATANDLHPT